MSSGIYAGGARAAEAILREYYRIDIDKALNPQKRSDFLVIQRRLSTALQRAAGGDELAALRRALNVLDVDWASMNAGQRARIFDHARSLLGGVPQRVLPRVTAVMDVESGRIVRQCRAGAISTFDLNLGTSLSLRDERVARFIRDSNVAFVRDEYGRRRTAFSERAREIVADAIDQGLGRDDIGQLLQDEFSDEARMSRDKAYWNVVSGAFVGRARSETNVGAFAEAAIERYRIEAVLDEVTTDICRFMHGREFGVRKAVERFNDVSKLTDPEDIKTAMPWGQTGTNDEGEPMLYFNDGDGEQQSLAVIDESGVGTSDAEGEYSGEMNEADLEAAGITTPPFHGNCRTTIVAIV